MTCTSLLVDLDSGLIGFDSNDFTNEVIVADTDLRASSTFAVSQFGWKHIRART